MAQAETGATTRQPRDLRYRKQFFPGAERLVFETRRAGYVPLPIIFRKLMRHLSLAEVRLYVYLDTRVSKHGICWVGMDEMLHELGVSSKKHVLPHLRTLEEKRLISSHSANGRKYFLIHDPRIALEHMKDSNQLTEVQVAEIDDLLEELGLAPLGARTETDEVML